MLTPTQRDQIVSILNAANDLAIATNRADGYPQNTVVSFVNDGLTLYFGTWSKSQKAANIARDGRVSVAITDPYKSWNDIQGVSIGGQARAVESAEEKAKVGQLMLRKFPQIAQMPEEMGAEMSLFRVDCEVISILDYTQGFGHTELARV